jgi:hypothetical protein
MGTPSPALALKLLYAQAMRRGEDEQAQLAALVAGESARKSTEPVVVAIDRAKSHAA